MGTVKGLLGHNGFVPRERIRPGPKPRLSRRLIAEAAIAIGFEQLTVTAVADRLGVSHAALYSHVRDRNDLVLAAAELITDELDWPPVGPSWRDLLRKEAVLIWATFRRHSGLYRAIDQTGEVPVAFRHHLGELYRHLVGLGFGANEALLAIDLVYDLAADSAERSAQLDRRDPDQRQRLAADWGRPLPGELGQLMEAAINADGAEWFGRKLEVVLDGIAVALAPDAGG